MIIKDLEDAQFVNRVTRVLFVDWTTYNPNVNLHCLARLAYEVTELGFINPVWQVKTWNLVDQVTNYWSWIVFLIFVVYYSYVEISELIDDVFYKGITVYNHFFDKGTWYFFWDVVDKVNLILFYMFIIWTYMHESYKSEFDMFDEKKFRSYRLMNDYVITSSYMQCINGVLLWFKIFKYCTFSKKVLMLIAMLLSASGPIAYFIFCSLCVTAGFAYQGYVLFSPDVYEFRSFQDAFANGLKYWATSLDVMMLRDSNRGMGLVFFIMWTIIFLLILASVFVAILMDAYDIEQRAIAKDERAGKRDKTFYQLVVQGFQKWQQRMEQTIDVTKRASLTMRGAGALLMMSSPEQHESITDKNGRDNNVGDDEEKSNEEQSPDKNSPFWNEQAVSAPGVEPMAVPRSSSGRLYTMPSSYSTERVEMISLSTGKKASPTPSPTTPVPSTPMNTTMNFGKMPVLPSTAEQDSGRTELQEA